MILYTTGEPCAMCTGAMLWSGIGGVVYASSIATIGRAGMGQIAISTKDVIAASDFWQSALLGGGSLSALLRGTDSELAEHRLNLL